MNRIVTTLAITLAAGGLMGFDSADPWSNLEGHWAYESVDNCQSGATIDFTYDYPRDENGDVQRHLMSASNEPRRVRLATVMHGGREGYRVTVRDGGRVAGDMQVELAVKHPGIWPFSRFSHMTFQFVDDTMAQEVAADGDGETLMRALGPAPVALVRCPAMDMDQ